MNAIVKADEQQPDPMMSMIERAARDPAVDIDKLERLFALRERMVAEDKKTAYQAAMVRAQARMKPVYRDAQNDHTNSAYSRLETISDAIKPIYTEEGFSLSFDTADSPKADHVRIVCEVMHSSGHSALKHFDLPLDGGGLRGNANKTPVQANGSTISYGRRYLTCMVFDVMLTNEDTDGNEQPAPVHETKGDALNNVPVDAARAMALRMIAALEADVEEDRKDLLVYDIHMELQGNNDMYIAASHQMSSKYRSAWKTYVKNAKARDAAEPRGPRG